MFVLIAACFLLCHRTPACFGCSVRVAKLHVVIMMRSLFFSFAYYTKEREGGVNISPGTGDYVACRLLLSLKKGFEGLWQGSTNLMTIGHMVEFELMRLKSKGHLAMVSRWRVVEATLVYAMHRALAAARLNQLVIPFPISTLETQ